MPLGPCVRLDVSLTDGSRVRVEVSRERYAALNQPHAGMPLYVTARDYKVFLDQARPK